MIKKIFYILLAVSLAVYILFGILLPKRQLDTKVCENVQIVITDTLDRYFISKKEIESMLKNSGLYPKGKVLKDINTGQIEDKLEENNLIKKVQAYKTIAGTVKIKVYQKIPLMRVMSVYGDFYVDTEAEIMPVNGKYAAYVPLVSGYVDKEFARKELFLLVNYLRDSKFWDAQIEQIYVHPDKNLELTPRIGNHQILLGDISDFEEKFQHLRLFYEQVMDKVGWNRYSMINLKFKNQIVCTKRQ